MNKRQLGRSGLMVSPLCLGGNVFGWTADETRSFRILDAFGDADQATTDGGGVEGYVDYPTLENAAA